MYWLVIFIVTTVAFIIFTKYKTKKLLQFSYIETSAIIITIFVFGYIGGRIDCIIQYEILQENKINSIRQFVKSFFYNSGFKNPLSFMFAILSLFSLSIHYYKNKIRFLQALDKFIVFAAFCFVFGNFACFFDGHTGCRGTSSNLPWACTYSFSNNKSIVPLHPVQLYYSLFFTVVFIISLLLKEKKEGNLFLIFMSITNIFFIFMDFIKERQIILYNISYSQIIYLTNVVITIVLTKNVQKKVKYSSFSMP